MATLKVDWSMLVLNLRRHKPLSVLSLELGKDKDYCGRLARGAVDEPKFLDGLKLLDLHLDLCGLDRHTRLVGK